MRAKPVFTYSLVAGALAFQSHALALGLGKLTVESALGQPLSARIELTSVTKEDLDSLRAKVADPALYKQNNLTYQGALSRARVSLESVGGTWVNQQCVRDGKIVTGQTWQSHPEFYREVMGLLGGQKS